MTDLHVVYTESGDDYGWTIASPQIPELIGGRATSDELIADTPEIVEWAMDEGQSFERVAAHEQHLVEDPQGHPYLIRWQFNDAKNHDARYETAGRLNYAVTSGLITPEEWGQHRPLTLTGERLYIAVVGTDRLGWIMDQLSPAEDCCVLAEHLGDGAVAHLPFAQSGLLRGGIDIEFLGLDRDSTFTEMLDAVLAREVESMRKTYLPREAVRDIPRHIARERPALPPRSLTK